ncbi:MAG: L,D-transpeptidase family protein [Thermomicrobiales bacterium]
MTRPSTHFDAVTSLIQRTNRRQLLSAAAVSGGLSLILPGHIALGQDSPPIEPIGQPDDDSEENDEQDLIAPDAEETPVDGENGVDYSATQYFARTGHNLETPFLGIWQDIGGEAVVGIPLSEARFVTGGGVQQSFQTLTLGYLPQNTEDISVAALPIDPNKAIDLAPESARKALTLTGVGQADQYFEATGHGISGKIGDFWNEIDGPRFLGSPLSEEFEADSVRQQLFERGVVELDGEGNARLQTVVESKLLDDAMRADPAFAPAPPTLGVTSLVTSEEGLRLRGGPSTDGEILGLVANNAEFIAAPGNHDTWVPGYADGASGWVAKEFLTQPEAIATVETGDWDIRVWQGASVGETNVREQPDTKAKSTKTLAYGEPVIVVDWIEGEAVEEDDANWAQLQDGGFVYVRNIIRTAPVAAPTLPGDAPQYGRWIDVHLTQQLMVAYEDREVQRVTVMTSGKPGWKTPEGLFAINTRVANETMDSGSIGAESFYKLEDVLFTQYFTDRGHALHFAWWKNEQTIGRPGSHGCLNLLLEEAQFYWDWATVGTPVYCHY